MKNRIKQHAVCKEAVSFIAERKKAVLTGIRFPDEEERNIKAVDMHCYSEEMELVVEHTQIESFPEQIADGIRLTKLLIPLQESLCNSLPMPGHYDLVVANGAVAVVKDGNRIRAALTQWIQRKAPTLQVGSPSTAPHHYAREIPSGVPFEVSLYRWPGLDGKFLISRFVPSELKEKRCQRIQTALEDKCPKLEAAKSKDNIISALILESNDIALGNHVDISMAVINEISKYKYKLPDDIYLIETEIKPWVLWVLKEGLTLFPNVINPGPHYMS